MGSVSDKGALMSNTNQGRAVLLKEGGLLPRAQSRCHKRIQVRTRLGIEAGHEYAAWAYNLSKSGLGFENPEQLDDGREITLLLFCSEEDENPIKIRCRIVWHDRCLKGTRHGCQFLFFAGDDKHRLDAYLSRLEAN
jgi:hypothetical protein